MHSRKGLPFRIMVFATMLIGVLMILAVALYKRNTSLVQYAYVCAFYINTSFVAMVIVQTVSLDLDIPKR